MAKKTFTYYPEVFLSGIHSGGRAVGMAGKKKFFVDGGVPGDVADLKVAKRQKGFVVASIERLITPSSHRIEPCCKHFGICGGCNWLNIDYNEQLNLKRNILLQVLQKYGIDLSFFPEIHPSPETNFFRNRTEYAFSAENSCLGYHPQGDPNNVFGVEECFIQPNPSRSICEMVRKTALDKNIPFYNYHDKTGRLRKLIIRTATTGDVMVILGIVGTISQKEMELLGLVQNDFPEITSMCYIEMSDGNQNTNLLPVHFISGSKQYYEEKAGKYRFQISPHTFYQPNPQQAVNIFEKVKEFAESDTAELVYDLYCGAGTLSLAISEKVKKVIGIEGSPDAVSDARKNALINGVEHVDFIQGDILRTFTRYFIKKYGNPDLIILDPPRSGTLIEIKKTILEAEPEKIIYVSCNPVSLAWDLKQLCEKYYIDKMELFDQHPHTHHLETVLLLTRK